MIKSKLKTREKKKMGLEETIKCISIYWSRSGLDNLLRRIDATGSADRGSGRPRSAKTSVSNTTKVEELTCSQENVPSTHKSPRKIEQITGIRRSFVVMLTDFLADHRPIAASLH